MEVVQIGDATLYHGDCLEVMRKEISLQSVDMVLCDLPYGRTNNKWDSIIPFKELWEQYHCLVKPNGAICLFADGMFMAKLMMSNEKEWRYNLIWDKVLPSGHLNANRQPLRRTEEICVFYAKQPVYNPQKVKGAMNHSKGKAVGKNYDNKTNYNGYVVVDNHEELGDMKHPTSLVSFSKTHPSKMVHPTEKPVDLCEWLVKTYTNEGDLVMDSCMGSGSTGVACMRTGRRFVGIELEKKYFEIARGRVENEYCGEDNTGEDA